jgi:hypothetical protein
MLFKLKVGHYVDTPVSYKLADGSTYNYVHHKLTHSTYETYTDVVSLVKACGSYVYTYYGPNEPFWYQVQKRTIVDEYDLPVSLERIKALWAQAPWPRVKGWRHSGSKRHWHRHRWHSVHVMREAREIEFAKSQGVHVVSRGVDTWDKNRADWGDRCWKNYRRTQWKD